MQERQLLEQLIPQMRELVAQKDSLTWRLFPNPFPDHKRAAADYSEMIGDELRQQHLGVFDTVSATLDAKRLTEHQLSEWMQAVNQLRLVIGTRLDIDETSGIERYEGETDKALFLTFSYLGLMLDHMVAALLGE